MPRPFLALSSSITTTRTPRCKPSSLHHPLWPDTDTAFTGPQYRHSPPWLTTSLTQFITSPLTSRLKHARKTANARSTLSGLSGLSGRLIKRETTHYYRLENIKMHAVMLNVTVVCFLKRLWAELNSFVTFYPTQMTLGHPILLFKTVP